MCTYNGKSVASRRKCSCRLQQNAPTTYLVSNTEDARPIWDVSRTKIDAFIAHANNLYIHMPSVIYNFLAHKLLAGTKL